jgi:predicted RNA methylase
MKYIKITDSAKEELRNASINGNILTLNGQVKNYAELKKIFGEIGVVWKKKEKHHILEPGAKEQIDFILNGGKIVDEKKTLQAFYTPLELVERVVELADVEEKLCLEPSCGDGRIIDAMNNAGAHYVVGIEIEPKSLTKKYPFSQVEVLFEDFLKIKTLDFKPFDRIVMNPPYDKNTWVRHISHAWDFLGNNGKLVAICPNAESNKQLQKFLEDKRYEVTPIEAGAFKESGTNIATMILEVWK